MIPDKYRTDEANAIWNPYEKYRRWFEVEKAVLGLHLRRLSPAQLAASDHMDLDELLRNLETVAAPTPAEVAEAEKTTGHEMGAFLYVLSHNRWGSPSLRHWVHHGLTSSDVQDTVDQLRCVRTSMVVANCARQLYHELDGRADLVVGVQGYTHGQPATPTVLLGRLLAHADPLRFVVRPAGFGMLSGATGTHPVISRDQEADLLWDLRRKWSWPALLQPLPYTTQVIPRQYMYAHARMWVDVLEVCEQLALDVRTLAATGDVTLPAVAVGSSAMPHKVNPAGAEQICGLARLGRGLLGAMGEGKALWQDRDLTHSSVDRVALPGLAHLTTYAIHKTRSILAGLSVPRDLHEPSRGRSEALLVALVETTGAQRSREELYRAVAEATRRKSADPVDVLADWFEVDPQRLRDAVAAVVPQGWV